MKTLKLIKELGDICSLIKKRVNIYHQIENREKEINKLRYQQRKDMITLKIYDTAILEKTEDTEFD